MLTYMRFPEILALVLVLVLSSSTVAFAEERPVAVLWITGDEGVERALLSRVAEAAREGIRAQALDSGWNALPRDAIGPALGQAGCRPADAGCEVRVARALAVERFVTGALSVDGSALVLELKLRDRAGQAVRTLRTRADGPGALLAKTGGMAAALFEERGGSSARSAAPPAPRERALEAADDEKPIVARATYLRLGLYIFGKLTVGPEHVEFRAQPPFHDTFLIPYVRMKNLVPVAHPVTPGITFFPHDGTAHIVYFHDGERDRILNRVERKMREAKR